MKVFEYVGIIVFQLLKNANKNMDALIERQKKEQEHEKRKEGSIEVEYRRIE